jgi:hypothetical protein
LLNLLYKTERETGNEPTFNKDVLKRTWRGDKSGKERRRRK